MTNRKAIVKGTIKISFIVAVLVALGFLVFNYALPALALHTSAADLIPEWSPAGQSVDYSAEISNTGGDTIYEVRIYKNVEYTSFSCEDKLGWEKLFISSLQACFYVTIDPDIAIGDGESTSFEFSATTPESSPENCNLEWKFETRDNINYWKFITDTTSVDDLPPVITKNVGDPKYEANGDLFITMNTPIYLSAVDEGACEPPSGIDYCQYKYQVDGGEWTGWTNWNPAGFTLYFPEDSTHVLEVKCVDEAGNEATLTETDIVETVPPETAKEFVGPQKTIETEGGIVEWIDGVTQIVLNPVDPEPHPSDVDKTWYINILDESEDSCWYPNYDCQSSCGSPYEQYEGAGECINSAQEWCDQNWQSYGDSWKSCVEDFVYGECQISCNGQKWQLYDGTPIQKEEESCHILQFFSVDNIGNVENVNDNCFFVDKTPPVLTKEVGDPEITGDGIDVSYDLSTTGDATAEISDEQADEGDDSIKLHADLITNYPPSNEARIYIPVDSFRLKDIYTIEWMTYVTMGYIPHVDIILDFDEDGIRDDALVVEYDKEQTPSDQLLGDMNFERNEWVDTFDDKGSVDDSSGMWLSSGAPGPVGGAGFIYGTLADWKAGTVDPSIDGDTKVIALEIEVDGWIAESEAYVDSIKLNGENMQIISWVTQNTPITFECYDQRPHPSEDEVVCYKVSFDDPQTPYLTADYCGEFGGTMEGEWCCADVYKQNNQYSFTFREESVHDLVYYCEDAVEKRTATHLQYHKVDTESPVITKEMFGNYLPLENCPPQDYDDTTPCYVADNGLSGVSISVQDVGHAAEFGAECRYELWWKGQIIQSGEFGEEGVDIYFTEDSEHTLKVNCEDALGNKMTEDVETFLVDSTSPVTTKIYGKPFVEDYFPKDCNYDNNNCNGEGCNGNGYDNGYGCGWAEWINSSTPISLSAEDNKVGVDKTYWRNLLITDPQTAYNICGFPEQYCNPRTYMQNVENPEEPFVEYTEEFYKTEESCHVIEYYSVDELGNKEDLRWQCVFVDNTAPEVDKTVGEPKEIIDDYIYITTETPITLSCWDIEPHPVDHVSLWYRYRVSEDCQNWDEWTAEGCDGDVVDGWCDPNGNVVEKDIYFEEDSCHELEYYCEDGLGNVGPTQTEIDIVDTQPPVIEKTIVGPQIKCTDYDGELDCFQIDGVTEIQVDAIDPEPHPVNDVKCDWSYEVEETGASGGEEKVTPPFVIQFPEESTHDLIITCRDALGNEARDEEIFIVDLTPPETTKTYDGPQYPEQGYPKWITSDTNVILGATDDVGPHDSGVKATYWRNTLVDDRYCWNQDLCQEEAQGLGEWNPYTDPFNKGEQSCHLIEYYSVDNVDKREDTKKQCVFIDNTPPVTTKEIIGPQYENDGKLYIDGVTEIKLTCEDQQPHPSGVDNIQYRYRVNDGEWTDWFVYEDQFRFPEESKHELEFYCNDTVGNKEETQTEIDYVDLTPPETTKTYEGYDGEPKWITTDTFISLDAEDEKSGVKETYWRNTLVNDEYCWDQELCEQAESEEDFQLYLGPFQKSEESCHLIEYYSVDNVKKTEETKRQCVFVDNNPPSVNKTVGDPKTECSEGDWCDWKVTIMTPIEFSCDDTHVIGEQEVCYRIFLDGELQDDWVCGEAPETIRFPEESNHTLEVYCKDALQIGPVDSENFKVEGTSFEITLKKKWNLISVPFVLWDSNITKVLGDVSEDISAIWTYDGASDQWFVYTPDDGPDSLTDLIPGWGYWVLAKNNTKILIAGSLFSPATAPPSRNLVDGWNLIGYYGTDWQDYSEDPECGGGDQFWRYSYCSLGSLVDTQQGYPRWSSLWTYTSCTGDDNAWKGLNACTTNPSRNRMVAGYGYWIEMDVDDTYAPATVCYKQSDCQYWPGPYG